MALNLASTVADFLQQNAGQKFTAKEIADWIFQTYPDACREKQQRSKATVMPLDSDEALLKQIVAEIGAQRPRLQKRYLHIKTTEGRPRKFYYTESSDSAEVEQAERLEPASAMSSGSKKLSEQDLYPLLSAFLSSELELYSKRIDEKRSRNSQGTGGNKWLPPDLVGLEDLSRDWHREIQDSVQLYGDKKCKLWSFEVKMLINRSNLREAFFQAVSNSSWANFGYLVANEISGVDTLKELRMLSSLHGIGFIQLSHEADKESQIMIPAKERSEINWDIANRLAQENTDFLNYIKVIRQFYQTGEIRSADWD